MDFNYPKTAVLFPSAARLKRLGESENITVPKDFFYGALNPLQTGKPVELVDTRTDPQGTLARLFLYYERLRNRFSNFGLTRTRVEVLKKDIEQADIALSFTDGFSLSLGYYRNLLPKGTVIAGGFHGLSDIADGVAPAYRGIARNRIAKAVHGLDHLFFFGEADRQEAVRRFGLDANRTSLFLFGIDTDYWQPAEGGGIEDGTVLSIGSDPKRDYATLIQADIQAPVNIITRLNIDVPETKQNVELIRGSYHGSPITDERLRQFYQEASVISVPIRDVFQPSGYSVTLQAMACGKPVVLSDIKGLWDPHLYKSGENCILVEPENPKAMADAVNSLMSDDSLRQKIGQAARDTAVQHFGLDRMDDSFTQLVKRLGS